MKNIVSILFLMFISTFANANNLNISNTSFSSANNTVTFTISWENSWRLSTGPSNWDAVWVFVKRQACSNTNIWASQLLSTTTADHTNSGALLTVDATSDGMGVFIRRASTATASGNITSTTVTLKFNTTATNTSPLITTGSLDNFKVMGVEMVYVPQGNYYLGDGRPTNSSNFSDKGNGSSPLLINSTIQNTGLGVSTNYCTSFTYGCPSALPNTFPIGYNGFYCMKYELTTAAYVDFLNTLNYDQQDAKFTKMNNSSYHANAAGSYLSFGDKGNINIPNAASAGIYNTKPATFTYNTTYASYSAAHYLVWQDLAAYLDWSGLRPMSEFEFEKACRGNNAGTAITPMAYEYPWGNTSITSGGNPNNRGSINESLQSLGSPGLSSWNYNSEAWLPSRGGAAATSTSNRSQAGATYYGIMEMGGNVWEQCVGGGSAYDYSTFRENVHGDGNLSYNGLANTTGWPSIGGVGSGTILRGESGFASLCCQTTYVQVSDRTFYAGVADNGGGTYTGGGIGGRGVRSISYP